MRFILRPRATLETLAAFVEPAIAAWVTILRKYGRVTPINYLTAFSVDISDEMMPTFRSDRPDLERTFIIRPAHAIHPVTPPADPPLKVPASLRLLELDQVWNLNVTGASVAVGVIDIGFGTHASFAKAIDSRHYFEEATKSFKTGQAPGNTDLQHGSLVAALIAGSPVTLAGPPAKTVKISAAPDARLHLIELPGIKFDDDLVLAIEFLASPPRRCRVISISLGTWEPSEDLDLALVKARAAGALTVAGIGNDGKGVAMWPGACVHALSVGYCKETGELSASSGSTHLGRTQRPIVPAVVAPGVGLLSADEKTGGAVHCNGSSYAAPLVAGMAALLFSDCDHAMPDQVEEAILASCKRLPGYDERCESGLPSAYRALQHLRMTTMC